MSKENMKTQTKHEGQKARIIKAARTAIRLKYSLKADEEMAERLPQLASEIDAALLRGKAFKMNLAALLENNA